MPFQSFNFLFRIEPTKEFKDLTVNSNLFKLPNHGAVFVLFNRLFQLGLFISPTRHIILSVGPTVYFGRRQSINGIIRGRRRNDRLRVGEAVNLDIPVRPRSQSSVATSRLIRRLIWFARPKLRPSVYCFIAADWTASLPAHEWASIVRPSSVNEAYAAWPRQIFTDIRANSMQWTTRPTTVHRCRQCLAYLCWVHVSDASRID